MQNRKRIRTNQAKRILSVTIKRMIDEDPDTSYLGEYSNKSESEYAIDRAHSEDCASIQPITESEWEVVCENCGTFIQIQKSDPAVCPKCQSTDIETASIEAHECDCHGGDMSRNEYRYFNGSVERYKGESPEDIRKYVRQDYERMESLNAGNWYYIGIRAEAEIEIENAHSTNLGDGVPYFDSTVQHITSGGLWGIESDSDKSYIKEIEQEELSNLKSELRALGFSTRAISQAFKSIKEVSE